MKAPLILIMILIGSDAMATKKPDSQNQVQLQAQKAVSTSISKSTSKSLSGAYSSSGDVYGGDVAVDAQTGDQNVNLGDTNVITKQRRQAPGVGLVVPPSTMDCSKGLGFGGSNKTGSMLLGWSWLQKDCMAMKQFGLLREMGLYEAAAKAYCSRKLFREPFGGVSECETSMSTKPPVIASKPVKQEKVVVNVHGSECGPERKPDAKGFVTSGKNGYSALECFELDESDSP